MIIPYITREILLPTSMVAMNSPGLLVKNEIILEPKAPCFLSSSIRSLLDEIKAISIPEKKAEKRIETNMIARLFIF